MIGYLRGKVIELDLFGLLLDVNGVGYRVTVAQRRGGVVGQVVELWVHTYVREDQISLYGFSDRKSLKCFEMLIGVSGVGPKVGMAILAASRADRVAAAISAADVDFFTSIPGIGKKGAQKIIIDLKNKMGSVGELDLTGEGGDEVAQALARMGYMRERVMEVLREVDVGLDDGEKLKRAIKKLSK